MAKAKPWEALQAPNPHAFESKGKTLGFAQTQQGNNSPAPLIVKAFFLICSAYNWNHFMEQINKIHVSGKKAQIDEKWILSSLLLIFSAMFFLPAVFDIFAPSVPEQVMQSLAAPATLKWRENFATYFISITLEAAPFMIIGAFVAALIEVLVPNDTLPRLFGKLGFLGIPAVILVSPIFPICECGVIIIGRKLLQKGMPLPHVISYLLAAPILNPVVLGGTYIAFYQDYFYPMLRGLGGISVALLAGMFFLFIRRDWAIKKGVDDPSNQNEHTHNHEDGCCDIESQPNQNGLLNKIEHLFVHVRKDFLEMGIYFLFGVFLASTMKTFVGNEQLSLLGDGSFTGPATMMIMAFVMSLCSEADAFLAASFVEFDMFSQMGFLVLGPMLDIKLLVMYRSIFTTRFILLLAGIVIFLVGLYIAVLQKYGEFILDYSMRGLM
ncbi:MAG: permease [Magnetococcales bacterium]|nr:permease [Magnetococcales bacterium]